MVDGPSRAEPERKLRSASFFRRLDDNRNNPLIATPTFRPSTKPIASHHIQFTEGLLAALAARIRCRFVRVNEYYYYSTADASLYKMRITTKPLWRLNKTGVYGHSPGRSRRARRHAVAKGQSVNRGRLFNRPTRRCSAHPPSTAGWRGKLRQISLVLMVLPPQKVRQTPHKLNAGLIGIRLRQPSATSPGVHASPGFHSPICR